MSVELFFPKLPSLHKTPWLTFNIYSLPIVVIYNQLDVNIYQQHISSICHHHKEHKQHTMYVQFFFLLWTSTYINMSTGM
jgi:hypothetical protein